MSRDLVKISAGEAIANLVEYGEAAKGAFSGNTERARLADSNLFNDWCVSQGRVSLPATPETIAEFVDAQAAEKSTATIRRYVSTIATLHAAAGVEPNPARSERVKMSLKRLSREKGGRQQQAQALNWEHISHALRAMSDKPRDVLDAALVCVGFDTLCRRSELVGLLVEDLQRNTDGSATVLIRRSKTDQEGMGRIAYLSPTTMEYLERWVAYAAITNGALFLRMDRHGNVSRDALSSIGVSRAFKRIAEHAGLEVDAVSGHSCRVGAAQDMAAADVEMSAIMQAGGWKSAAMPARYSERLQAKRSGMAKLAAIQGR